MAKYLLDTNVVLRFSNPSDTQHNLARTAVATLLKQEDECYLTTQVLIEFWVVATRPIEVNGLGWSIEQTRNLIDQLSQRFPIAEETVQLLPTWLNLVTDHQIRGKRTHDARLVAIILTGDFDCILTLNPNDFSGIPDITVVHPQQILESSE